MEEPISRTEMRALLRKIIEDGEISFSRHALGQMEDRELTSDDCLAVLRAGWCEFEELINNTWRYRITTHQICVVVAFRSETFAKVITAWRID